MANGSCEIEPCQHPLPRHEAQALSDEPGTSLRASSIKKSKICFADSLFLIERISSHESGGCIWPVFCSHLVQVTISPAFPLISKMGRQSTNLTENRQCLDGVPFACSWRNLQNVLQMRCRREDDGVIGSPLWRCTNMPQSRILLAVNFLETCFSMFLATLSGCIFMLRFHVVF